MVGVFCRGVCVRENLVIRIMCHQANDHCDGLSSWMALNPTIWIVRTQPSYGGFVYTAWYPQTFNLLTERTLRYQYPDGRSCYRTMMSKVFHMEASICYKHVQITYKPRERLANNMNERKVEMDHPSLPVAPARPSPCSMKFRRTFRSFDHNAPYTAFPSITVASTFVFKTWSAGTSIMSCENTT